MKNPLREQRLSKKFVALLLCVTVCFSLAVGSYLTRGTVFVGNLTEVWQNPPFSSPNWQVGQVNATYFYTQNCTSGQWAYEGTNATLAVQYALDRGGRIVVSSGTFKVYGNIEPKSNCYLQSQPDTIFLKVNSAGNQITALSQASSLMYRKANYKLENFTVDGGVWNYNKPTGWKTHRTDANWTTYYNYLQGIFFGQGGAYTPENVVVKNVIVKNILGYGIMLYMCHNSKVLDSKVYDCGDNAISISASDDATGEKWIHDVVVEGCYETGAADVGINVFFGRSVKISKNFAKNNQQSGGSNWGIAAEAGSSQILIDGNTVSGNDFNIVTSGGAKNITITNNVINGTSGSSRYGIETQAGSNIIVSHNQLLGCAISFATYGPTGATGTYDVDFSHNIIYGGYAYIHGHGIKIDNNEFFSTDSNGAIYLHGADSVTIRQNTFRGTYGIRDFAIVSTGVIIQFNDFSELTSTKVSLLGTVDLTMFGNEGVNTVQSEYSYIIGKYNSTFFYAMNMTTGRYDSLTNNASTTIQYAINQYASKSVYLLDGIYTIKPQLTITKDYFEFAGTWNSILFASASLPMGYSGNVLIVDRAEGVYIHNIQVHGNRLNRGVGTGHEAGINLASCNYTVIEDCYVHDCPSIGIGGSNALYSKRSYFNQYLNNVVIQSEWNGITEGGDDYPSVGVKILENTVINYCDVGISCYGFNSIIANNHLALNSSLDSGEGAVNSYWAFGMEGNYDYNNTVSDNFVDYSLCTVTVGTLMSIKGSGQLFQNNELIGNSNVQGGISVDGSDNNVIRGGSIRNLNAAFANGIAVLSGSNYTVISSISFSDISEKAVYFQSTNSKTVIMGCTIRNTPNFTSGDASVKIKDNFNLSTNSWIADV